MKKSIITPKWMKRVIIFLACTVVGAALYLPHAQATKKIPYQTEQLPLPVISQNYLSALRTADTFLSDWLTYNTKGVKLMSPKIQHHTIQLRLKLYFKNTGAPFHSGYEVLVSKELSPNLYQFSVWMYGYAMGLTGSSWKRPHPDILDVEKIKNTWYISNLPKY